MFSRFAAALLLPALMLVAGPTAAGPLRVKNCSDLSVAVVLKDSEGGPAVATGQLTGLNSLWDGACAAAQCRIEVSSGGMGGSTTAADNACVQPLRLGGTGPVIGIFPVPGSLCTC
ncbi:MAG: hypothetical protein AB7O45_10455 [Alphaproteobacteria bacterium]